MFKWEYKHKGNDIRFVLGEMPIINTDPKLLCCVGVNPSTAIPENLDNTLTLVKNRSLRNGYDGWLMFNLYPKRCTIFKELIYDIEEDIIILNLNYILDYYKKYDADLWCAWGGLIENNKKIYFNIIKKLESLVAPISKKIIKVDCGTKHPHHPLYIKKDVNLVDFNFSNYTKNLV